MLRKKALNRIYLTTLVLFIMTIMFSMDIVTKDTKTDILEVEYVFNMENKHIYLLNSDNLLVKVDTLLDKGMVEDMALEILEQLYSNQKKYGSLKGLIPLDTKILDIKVENETIIVDFSKELLNIGKNIEEKLIESIVYTLLELDNIKNVKIKIEGELLTKLEKSNTALPLILDESFGINKTYQLTSLKDTKKVVLYYGFMVDNNNYFVPVTKYVNSSSDKIKIIIDTLQGNYLSSTNLNGYLTYKSDIKSYRLDEDILTITFSSLNEDNLEEVTYSLASSVFDTMDISKVIFEVDSKIIDIKTSS